MIAYERILVYIIKISLSEKINATRTESTLSGFESKRLFISRRIYQQMNNSTKNLTCIDTYSFTQLALACKQSQNLNS